MRPYIQTVHHQNHALFDIENREHSYSNNEQCCISEVPGQTRFPNPNPDVSVDLLVFAQL